MPAKRAARPRPADVYARDCPSRSVLDHLTSRWGVLILGALLDGTHRFSELRRRIGGVSEKMLAQTLQTLEADGFLDRVVYPEIPPRVEYSLTPLGREAAHHVSGVLDWIEKSFPRIDAARARRAKAAAKVRVP